MCIHSRVNKLTQVHILQLVEVLDGGREIHDPAIAQAEDLQASTGMQCKQVLASTQPSFF